MDIILRSQLGFINRLGVGMRIDRRDSVNFEPFSQTCCFLPGSPGWGGPLAPLGLSSVQEPRKSRLGSADVHKFIIV